MMRETGPLRALGSPRRGSTVTAVAMVALVVGLLTMLADLWRSVHAFSNPLPGSERLVMLWERDRDAGIDFLPLTESAFPYYQQGLRTQASIGFFVPPFPEVPWEVESEGPVVCARLSPEMLDVLNVRPLVGRGFSPGEGLHPGAPSVAILSYDYWVTRHSARPDVLGTRMALRLAGDPQPHEVIGVMPRGFRFPSPLYGRAPDVWINARRVVGRFLPGNNFYVVGRLLEGATTSSVRDSARVVAEDLRRREPRWYGPMEVDVASLSTAALRSTSGVFTVLALSALLAVLLGASNFLHIATARAWEKAAELRVRIALGATMPRLVRSTLYEGLCITIPGAIAGFLLAGPLLSWARTAVPGGLRVVPTRESVLDMWPALIALTLGFALGVGLAAILSVTAWRQRAMLLQSVSGGRVTRAVSTWPVATQIGVAFALAATASSTYLGVRDRQAAAEVVAPQRLLALDLFVPAALAAKAVPALRAVVEQLRGSEGIEAVALVSAFPSSAHMTRASSPDLDGRPVTWLPVEVLIASERYPDTSRLAVIRGRWFAAGDDARQRRVVVVNEVLADRYFRGKDPIGRRLQLQSGSTTQESEIVGVVTDPRLLAPDLGPRSIVYTSWEQAPLAGSSVIIRVGRDARAASASIVHRVSSALPPGASVRQVRTGTEMLREATATASVVAAVLLAIAAITGTFALAGVAALAHWQSTAKRGERGIRRALGATPTDTARIMLRALMLPVAMGLMAGAVVGFGAAKAIERYVPSIECVRPYVWLASAAAYVIWALTIGLSTDLATMSDSVVEDLRAL